MNVDRDSHLSTPGTRSQILFTLGVAFAINFASLYRPDQLDRAKEAHTAGKQVDIIGFALLTITLVAASDFQTTQQLALAFAWLILIATLALHGTQAFKHINRYHAVNTPARTN